MKGQLFISCMVVIFCLPLSGLAQHDSAYYESYSNMLTGRFYFSQKYTSFSLDDSQNDLKDLEYHPNTTLNMGVGATYDWFSLNLAYGFGFLNPENGQGETEYLDLQTHFYGQRFNVDLFGQFYSGFYLDPKGKGTNSNNYYIRPDLNVREFGANVQYLFNNKKMSYRAAYLNNQWQKKSAGSLLAGLEFYLGSIKADSSLYPASVYVDTLGLDYLKFFEVGPNVGYAYTLVIAKHFFITGALSASLDYNVTTYESQQSTYTETGISPNTFFRLFAGYNSTRNAISVTFTNSRVALNGGESVSIGLNTGNLRINFVRRFNLGTKTQKMLEIGSL